MTGGDANRVPRRQRRVSPTAIFLATLVLVLVSLLALGIFGAIILLVLAAAMAVLLALTWSRHDPRNRAIRIVIVLLLVGLAALRLATP